MKKLFLIAALLCITGLTACAPREAPVLTGITFERGSGSVWGNQFYIQVTPEKIAVLEYVDADSGELMTLKDLPILPQQWEQLERAVLGLDLEEKRSGWKDKLLEGMVLDGGDFRNLTLTHKTGEKEVSTAYQWSSQASALEAMLETLAETAKAEEPEDATEVYNAGQFLVTVPKLWRAIPIEDPFAEGRPVMTDCVFLRKGGESDWNESEKPYIRIDYYSPEEEMERQPADGDLQRNPEDISPMALGEYLWTGYTADDYQGRASTGRFAMLWAEKGGHKFQVYVWFSAGGDTITLADEGLQDILSGLVPAGQTP